MAAHDFNRAILEEVGHRPWPMPAAPWLMTQTWHDLLFAHWPMPAAGLRAAVPPEFDLDLFNGTAWLGVVAFHMTNVAPRGVPSLPWISEFPELNVRTYVRVGDKPGIYFFSLDAASAMAVQAARTLLNLPYFVATMRVTSDDNEATSYESDRTGGTPAQFVASYRPTGPTFTAARDTLEYFLTERYCLFNRDHAGRGYRLDIHHPPWPVQPAAAVITSNSMAAAAGLAIPEVTPLLHFAKRQDMVAWPPASLG